MVVRWSLTLAVCLRISLKLSISLYTYLKSSCVSSATAATSSRSLISPRPRMPWERSLARWRGVTAKVPMRTVSTRAFRAVSSAASLVITRS